MDGWIDLWNVLGHFLAQFLPISFEASGSAQLSSILIQKPMISHDKENS